MTLTTLQVGAAVTPTVIRTGIEHYTQRKPRHKKPTAHISYDEGLNLIRQFLTYVSSKTVEDLQSFTAGWVPHAQWIRTEQVPIPEESVNRAAELIIKQLGEDGVKQIGGRNWWQWRRKHAELKAEYVEMRSHFNELKTAKQHSKRIMMYMHGGGYFFGSVDEHRYQLQRHARKLKARVVAPRYRLAPQFPFPCGVQDCLAVYLYLLTIHQSNEIILAGDSAGGGMVLTLMCILRDQGLPLPAGGILISPWVDLSHSFPSVSAENPLDYIPPHGFHQKPSISWPPPNDDEEAALTNTPSTSDREKAFIDKTTKLAQKLGKETEGDEVAIDKTCSVPIWRMASPSHQLSIKIDGKTTIIKEQFQMYTTNGLISHPLVSPALQPSLGGLPPLLVMTGGGEMLRDEQIYIAHKAANPAQYPLGDAYRSKYDPDDTILKKYKPTPVQLQVWEDLCHVAPTLSFTRPAKYMYRSIAQFGAWALARAQSTSIEIVDDDNISMISSGSRDSDTDSTDSIAAQKKNQISRPAIVGRVGDPLPTFVNHMVRQRIDRYGNIYELAPASELPATIMSPNEVGMLKEIPVKKWLHTKKQWDDKYAGIKKKVQRQRLQNRAAALPLAFGPDEIPPPSALAGRRIAQDDEPLKLKKGHLLAMWSGWGSSHDNHAIQREEKMIYEEQKQEQQAERTKTIDDEQTTPDGPTTIEPDRVQTVPTDMGGSRRRSSSKKQRPNIDDRSRSRRRTISVVDQGQLGGGASSLPVPTSIPPINADRSAVSPPTSQDEEAAITTPPESSATDNTQHLAPMFIPKFKVPAHLRTPSHNDSAAASMRDDISIADNASTMAVFGAPGISRVTSSPLSQDDRPTTSATTDTNFSDKASTIRSPIDRKNAADGYDTPVSRRSMERLQTNQVGEGQAPSDQVSMLSAELRNADTGRDTLRSPSNIAIVRSEGTVDVVPGGEADPDARENDGDVDGFLDGTPVQDQQKQKDKDLGNVIVNGNVKVRAWCREGIGKARVVR